MFERTKIAERLWAQAAMCDEAAQFYPERIVATHLKRLAEYCRGRSVYYAARRT
jgi:hypothetical protein